MSSDPILANAVQRRDAAAVEMRRWDDFISMYQELAGRTEPRSRAATLLETVHDAQRQRLNEAAKGALAETEAVAVTAIHKAGRPLHTRELLETLAAQGLDIGGKDPASTLSARLSRAVRLENVRPYGWRIKQSPNGDEPAGDMLPSNPAGSGPTPNSADQDGREVAHDNMSH